LALGMGVISGAQLSYAQQDSAPPVAPPALAQAAPEQTLERVEITGSNIHRAESETAENVTVITAEQLKRSGQPTVADFLHTVSANFASFNETFINSFAPGAAGMALRGLSQKNTLVLLNGRRIANYGFAQNLEDTFVDLNVIPTIAVERIEILKSGAAAVYGSDATAGVVNIILKKNSTDRIIDAGVSTTADAGGGTRDAALALGFGDFGVDRYNVYVTGTFFKRDDLSAVQRPYTAAQDFRDKPDGYLTWLQSANYTNNSNTANTAFATCGANGLPGQVVNMSQFPTTVTGTTCAYNPASQFSLIPGTQRVNLTAMGNFKLSSEWTAFSDVLFSNIKTTSLYSPASLGPTSIAYNPATGGISSVSNVLPAGNPSNPYGVPTQIDYVFQSVGGRNEQIISNTYRVSGGVKGFWANWEWEAAYGHSENHVAWTNFNSINVAALENAIQNGSFDFLNPSVTPDANEAIGVRWEIDTVSKLDTFGAKGNGSLLALPAGSLDGAFGVEFRHESIDDVPPAILASGNILDYGLASVDGGRSVVAAFAEIAVPVVRGLDADVAAREEHYTDVGGNFSPQAALRWHPVREITARAVASKGFRAPSLPEISNASSVSFQSVTDPFDPLGRPSEPIAVLTQANPNLRPETSKNLDLGLVYSPLANLSLSVDYYKISIDHVIATENTPQNIIQNPAAYPGQIFRTASGLLNYVVVPYENIYQIMTSGVDVEGEAFFRLSAGARLYFDVTATYVANLMVGSNGSWTDYAGTNGWAYNSPISGGGPVPRWRGTLRGGWENPNWVTQVALHYTASYTDVCYADGFCGPEAAQVASYSTVDLFAQYTGLKKWTFSASVINLANATPPWDWFAFSFSGYEPFDQTLYDARGRVIALRAQYRF